MNNYQDYYFQKQSEVLFVDEDAQAVGILNSNPSYTLDINGNMSVSNIVSTNVVADHADMNTILANNIFAVSNVSASHLVSQSNLKVLNTWINQECPIPNQGSLFGFSLGGGFIDPSWIKTDNDWGEILDSLWNLSQTGYDIFQFVRSIFDEQGKLADDLKDALNEALDEGGLRVPWSSLNNKPIYASESTKDVGMSGDVYFNEAKTLYSLNSGYFSSVGDNGNLNLTSTQGKQKFLNVGSLELFMKDITTSNITSSNMTVSNMWIMSNLQVPTINATNKTTTQSAVVNDTLRVGNFYVRSSGIYVGNPDLPLTSQIVIDPQGYYKGTIDRNQLTNLEAFNLSALADGNLIFGTFGDATVLNDPFAFQPPLFNIG